MAVKLWGKLTEQSDSELAAARTVFGRSKKSRDKDHLEAVEAEIWARQESDKQNDKPRSRWF